MIYYFSVLMSLRSAIISIYLWKQPTGQCWDILIAEWEGCFHNSLNPLGLGSTVTYLIYDNQYHIQCRPVRDSAIFCNSQLVYRLCLLSTPPRDIIYPAAETVDSSSFYFRDSSLRFRCNLSHPGRGWGTNARLWFLTPHTGALTAQPRDLFFSDMHQGSIIYAIPEPEFSFVLPDLVASSIKSHEISFQMLSHMKFHMKCLCRNCSIWQEF